MQILSIAPQLPIPATVNHRTAFAWRNNPRYQSARYQSAVAFRPVPALDHRRRHLLLSCDSSNRQRRDGPQSQLADWRSCLGVSNVRLCGKLPGLCVRSDFPGRLFRPDSGPNPAHSSANGCCGDSTAHIDAAAFSGSDRGNETAGARSSLGFLIGLEHG